MTAGLLLIPHKISIPHKTSPRGLWNDSDKTSPRGLWNDSDKTSPRGLWNDSDKTFAFINYILVLITYWFSKRCLSAK